MKIHLCTLDRDCRSVGAPPRLHITTKRWMFTLALTPNAKMQKRPYDYVHFGWWVLDRRR